MDNLENSYLNLTPLEEANLRVQTVNLYKRGGVANVLAAISTMTKCQKVILTKLNEILEERDYGSRKP